MNRNKPMFELVFPQPGLPLHHRFVEIRCWGRSRIALREPKQLIAPQHWKL
jgi:hypothetical protein